jgi:uncharacterized protein
MKLSDGEKLMLIMLSEIHERLEIKNGVDTRLVKAAIYDGHLWALEWELSGLFHGSEPSDEVLTETVNILEMWTFVERSYEGLPDEDKARIEAEAAPLGKYVQFSGFDGNNEAQYNGVARFLVDELGRFSAFKGRELNSHMPSLAAHRRMLAVFTPLRSTSDLTASEIVKILQARIHPENRKVAGAS